MNEHVSSRRKSAETDGATSASAVRADGSSAAPALTLPGATGYAPVVGAEFPATQLGAGMHAADDQGWPICGCAPCRAKSKAMNDAFISALFPRWSGPDTDKQDAIDNDEDYDVFPTQSGSR